MANYNKLPEGATSVCRHCGQNILLDQREGGGPGKDWGASPDDWVGNGGIGMDYGCPGSPESDDESTGGHVPSGLITVSTEELLAALSTPQHVVVVGNPVDGLSFYGTDDPDIAGDHFTEWWVVELLPMPTDDEFIIRVAGSSD